MSKHPLRRFVERHRRLVVATTLGILTALACAYADVRPLRSLLIGWNVACWTYFSLLGWLMVRADHSRTREISEEADPSARVVQLLLASAAAASVVAIGAELVGNKGLDSYLVAGSTLFASWLMINTLYAFHYAHLFFRSPEEQRPLLFPDGPSLRPDYGDFLYFSFTVAVAAQTADVGVIGSPMRRVVLAHSLLAFFFNVAILGATVNVVSGLVAARSPW